MNADSYQSIELQYEQMEISGDEAEIRRTPREKQIDDEMSTLLSFFSCTPDRQIFGAENIGRASSELEIRPTHRLISPPRRFFRAFWRGLSRRLLKQQVSLAAEPMGS